MPATLAQLGRITYLAFIEPQPKKYPITRTMSDAINRYRSRNLTDPDHVLLHPAEAAAVGPAYTHPGKVPLTVAVAGHPIVHAHEVYVGRFEEV